MRHHQRPDSLVSSKYPIPPIAISLPPFPSSIKKRIVDLCLLVCLFVSFFLPSSLPPLSTLQSPSRSPRIRALPVWHPSPPTILRQAHRNRGRPHSASAVSCGATSVFPSGRHACATAIIAPEAVELEKKKKLGMLGMEKNEKAGKGEKNKKILRHLADWGSVWRDFSSAETTLHRADLLTTCICLFCRLACSAFEAVFQKRQTKFGGLLAWLEEVKRGKALRAQAAGLSGIVERCHR